MSLVPMNSAHNIRQPSPEEFDSGLEDHDVIVEHDDGTSEVPEYDSEGNVLSIEHSDGSITVSLDGRPIESAAKRKRQDKWFGNLIDEVDDMEQARIVGELLRGIEADIQSRREWLEDIAQGIKLLGLKIEIPGTVGTADGAPVEGMSKVRHPLLLEAVLRFQANARSELLPTDGPVKIREDNNNATIESDELADQLENDMNHYLTSTAKEYYPDTDRMLFMLGFAGCAFKKVYNCPLRNRPISESVDAENLIVNNSATDLANALRVTHRSFMKPSTIKRMQIIGAYADIDLGTPLEGEIDAAQRAKADQQGVDPDSMNPEDRDREIYECYCELDVKGFEHKSDGEATGLEIPYRVTIDVSSRKMLSMVRNFDEDTKDLPEARTTFVKYSFVPGLGFYDIGLLHILGNTTNAATAGWREMLDAGMFASFPGFLYGDVGARQNTNVFRVPPGGGALVKTGDRPIRDVVMPLPYQPPSPALMQLIDNMVQTGQRVGGTAEAAVGEGRNDAPVGTTIALIDQATKVLNSVHKRLHAAQAEEFEMLVRCFRENPKAFWQFNKRPARKWDQETFMRALDQIDLVPQADPNTSSQTQRLMKVVALKQIQQQNPTLYNPIAVDTVALRDIGWSNPDQFFIPQEARGQKPPELQQKDQELQIKQQEANTKQMSASAKAQLEHARLQLDAAQPQDGGPVDNGPSEAEQRATAEELAIKHKLADAKLLDTKIKGLALQQSSQKDQADNLVNQQELLGRERNEMIELAKTIAVHPDSENVTQNLLGNVIPAITGRAAPKTPSTPPLEHMKMAADAQAKAKQAEKAAEKPKPKGSK